MAPKTVATPEQVAAQLAEDGVEVDNRTREDLRLARKANNSSLVGLFDRRAASHRNDIAAGVARIRAALAQARKAA